MLDARNVGTNGGTPTRLSHWPLPQSPGAFPLRQTWDAVGHRFHFTISPSLTFNSSAAPGPGTQRACTHPRPSRTHLGENAERKIPVAKGSQQWPMITQLRILPAERETQQRKQKNGESPLRNETNWVTAEGTPLVPAHWRHQKFSLLPPQPCHPSLLCNPGKTWEFQSGSSRTSGPTSRTRGRGGGATQKRAFFPQHTLTPSLVPWPPPPVPLFPPDSPATWCASCPSQEEVESAAIFLAQGARPCSARLSLLEAFPGPKQTQGRSNVTTPSAKTPRNQFRGHLCPSVAPSFSVIICQLQGRSERPRRSADSQSGPVLDTILSECGRG